MGASYIMGGKLLLATSIIVATVLLLVPSASASAESCLKVSTRFASTSNTLYLTGSNTICTPADLNLLYPKQMVKVGAGVYLLRSHLVLQTGASFIVEGTAIGGTTNVLRLMSNNNSTTNNLANITADQGKIRFASTQVTSWNEAAAGPDTEYGSTYKRASIKVRSRVVNGVPNISRMDILDSNIGYLGYNGAEAYGLAWKVMDNAFAAVDVLGDIRNSRIHHNYFGAYMYGAYGMVIDNNEFDKNIKYGLDPHDDSDALTITNNRSHHNGNHGIICSQRCDNIVIRGNQSYNNIGHGIMIHRSVDNSVVENNTSSYNTDTGIALFESNHNIIRNNTVVGNKHGIRLSVGSSYNQLLNNTVDGSTGNALYTYVGSDIPVRGDGVNRGNIWNGNIVKNSKYYVLKLAGTDGDRFEANDFRGNGIAKYDISRATNTVFVNNQTDPGVNL
jgi:parallel beta-helix repeat protein